MAAVVCATLTVGAAACGGYERTAEQVASDTAFGWKTVGDGLERGTLQVPIDYDNPAKGSFTLNVVRRLATDPAKRIGSLLVNPGGPGFGGAVLAEQATRVYTPDLLAHFDIVAWDPRGTGASEPHIDCIDEYDPYYGNYDVTPDNSIERQQVIDLAEQVYDACAAKNADILQFVGTNNSARDMNAIREALGEEKISYFGFSYGSELGATWVTMFPDTVRAAVFDGAADPTADPIDAAVQQTIGFENTLATYLAACCGVTACPFHNNGDAAGAYDTLMSELDENPIAGIVGRPKLTRAMAIVAVAQSMYRSSSWNDLSLALMAAQEGSGAGLMALYDSYYQRRPDGTYGNELEAFQVITCMDKPDRLTIAEEDAAGDRYRAAAPRMSPNTVGNYGCAFFPPSDDPRVTATGEGAGPILVVGTTGDAATPLEGTRRMASAMEDGRLLVVTADQHTGYNVSECSHAVVDSYLIDPVTAAPAEEVKCL